MNDEMEMMGGSGTKCKPQYSERMLNVFNPHLSAPDEKAVVYNLRFQTQEKFTDIWLVLTIQTAYSWAFAILLLYAKTSRENIAIDINLLRSYVSEKFIIIDPL
jgi:hypothetical protein